MRKKVRTDDEKELRRLWLERPKDQRTENDVIHFHSDILDKGRSNLLADLGGAPDHYQQLKVVLSDLITRK